ncbi:hypothetical protein NIIDMKKI_71280 [Mycobacterium kansasii]|uniref:Transcriptional regulator LmrA/YxaF-like C-terminal domain-containing protein n=1 Tax=Mycobacterium kansasii TaxID=1768 RepID=A0A7G1IP58_MYCKA|nr:hypothetical protein NIIDMKKI_71280 [Mycobacterium kansasii]
MLLREFVDYWQHLLTEGDFTAGCPVAAAALGSADDGLELSTEAGTILNGWCSALTRAFITDGFGESDAAALAVTSVAALEGPSCCAARRIPPSRCAQLATSSNFWLPQGNSFVVAVLPPITTARAINGGAHNRPEAGMTCLLAPNRRWTSEPPQYLGGPLGNGGNGEPGRSASPAATVAAAVCRSGRPAPKAIAALSRWPAAA